jgi:hypothetical protein
MKTRYTLIALAALGAAPALFGAAPSVRLEPDVPVTLRLKQTLSSETARVNDRVEFEVTEDVSAGGAVVIRKGSAAWGRVADAAPVGRLMGNGRLAVDIESVALADGGSVRLRASGAGHPGAKKPPETTSGAPGTLPTLSFTRFQHGKAIEIPAGRLVTVYTAAPVLLGSKAQSRDLPARPAALQPPALSASVLPSIDAAPGSVMAVDRGTATTPAAMLPAAGAASRSAASADRGTPPPATTSAAVLPAVDGAPEAAPAAGRVARASSPTREPVSVSRGGSKKLLTIVAVGAAAGLAGVLAAKARGGAQTIAAPGTTTTTVGIGQITVGGPH